MFLCSCRRQQTFSFGTIKLITRVNIMLVDLSNFDQDESINNELIGNVFDGIFEDRKFDEDYAEVLYQRIIEEFEKYLKE